MPLGGRIQTRVGMRRNWDETYDDDPRGSLFYEAHLVSLHWVTDELVLRRSPGRQGKRLNGGGEPWRNSPRLNRTHRCDDFGHSILARYRD